MRATPSASCPITGDLALPGKLPGTLLCRALHDSALVQLEPQQSNALLREHYVGAGINPSASIHSGPLLASGCCRQHVLVRLPQLRMLDGQAVALQEVAAAPGVLQQEESVMAMMVSNACLVHKLVSA